MSDYAKSLEGALRYLLSEVTTPDEKWVEGSAVNRARAVLARRPEGQAPAAPPSIPAAWQDPDCPRHVLSAEDMRDYTNADLNSAVTRVIAARCTRPLYAAPPSGVQAAEQGWIPWEGGACPVGPETVVFVRFTDGTYSPFGLFADAYEWKHWRTGNNIVAYYVVTDDVDSLSAAPHISAALKSPAAAPPVAPAPAREAGTLKVAVDLLREVVGPLEVSAAIIEDEDGGEAIESLIDNVKRYVEQFDLATLSAAAPAEPSAVEADAKRLDFLEALRLKAQAKDFKWDKWLFVTDAPIRAQLDAALRAQSAAVEAAPMVKE
jgi:hypothetical protein